MLVFLYMHFGFHCQSSYMASSCKLNLYKFLGRSYMSSSDLPRNRQKNILHFVTFGSLISVYVAGPQPPQQPGAPPQQGQQQNPQQGGPQSLPLSISGATAPLVSYPIMTQELRPVLQTSLSHWSSGLFLFGCLTVFSGPQIFFLSL